VSFPTEHITLTHHCPEFGRKARPITHVSEGNNLPLNTILLIHFQPNRRRVSKLKCTPISIVFLKCEVYVQQQVMNPSSSPNLQTTMQCCLNFSLFPPEVHTPTYGCVTNEFFNKASTTCTRISVVWSNNSFNCNNYDCLQQQKYALFIIFNCWQPFIHSFIHTLPTPLLAFVYFFIPTTRRQELCTCIPAV
jgi:hypothetical protein